MPKRRIAFLGLGAMGAPMARRLLAPDYQLTVWNRSPERAAPFALLGAQVAASAAEAVGDADIVITMLADPAAVLHVILEVAPALRPGAHLIEASTIGPKALLEVDNLLPPGVTLVDAPVMGSVDRAAEGTLSLLVGGDIEPVADVLARFGTATSCGPGGAGAAMKVVLISAIIAGVTAIGESMVAADAFGLPQDLVVQAMTHSPLAGIAARAFAKGSEFPIHLAAKDVALAIDTGDLPLARAVHARLIASPAQDDDLARVVELIRAH
jgi:3-hydroxyisobutyrate dehydrogenase-like beta-hydroxyacid dehydrogenase